MGAEKASEKKAAEAELYDATPSASSTDLAAGGWAELGIRPTDDAALHAYPQANPLAAHGGEAAAKPALDFDQIAMAALSANDPARPGQATWGGGGVMSGASNAPKQKWGMASYKSIFKNTPW